MSPLSSAHPGAVSATSRPHLAVLDSLRGIAAMLVALMHFQYLVDLPLSLSRFYLMVDLFFVLSGFAISYAYHGQLRTVPQVGRFMWLRFWRLYPLHLVMMIYIIGIELLKFVAVRLVPVHHSPFSLFGWRSVISNLLLLQAFNTTDGAAINTPSWSISAEFYAYFLFAIISVISGKRSRIVAASAVICISALWGLAHVSPAMNATLNYGWLRGLAGFFAGVLTFAAYDMLRHRIRTDLGMLALALLGLLMAFVARAMGGSYFTMAIVPLCALVILSMALSRPDGVIRILCIGPVRWLGTVSYSIYMTHDAINSVFHYLTRVLFHRQMTMFSEATWTGVYIATVLAIASQSYRWIEMPARNWSRRHRQLWERKKAHMAVKAEAP